MKSFPVSRLTEFFESLKAESDRACAVLGAAFLDKVLEDAVLERFPAQHHEPLLSRDGPMGTFSRRISLAYALNLLHRDTVGDLNIVRLIRNDFAHDFDHALSFQSQSVRDRSRSLTTVTALSAEVNRVQKSLVPSDRVTTAVDATIANLTAPRSAFELSISALAFCISHIPSFETEPLLDPPSSAEVIAEMARQAFGL